MGSSADPRDPRGPPEVYIYVVFSKVNTRTGKEEVGWTKVTPSNVGHVKSSLDRSSARSIARDREGLAKMKPFQQGLLVLKYTCHRPFMDFDGRSAGQFRFKNIVIYLTK